MTPTRAALLRDVAGAIVASGYAIPPQAKRPHIWRAKQIAELARHHWIDCDPHSAAYSVLIDDVMHRYHTSRWTARKMARLARKMREERHADT